MMIRIQTEEVTPSLAKEMRDVILVTISGPRSSYDLPQQLAWKEGIPDGDDWTERVQNQTIVTAREQRSLAGFLSLTKQGLVDFAFVLPQYQGLGLFTRLVHAIEAQAQCRAIDTFA